MIIDLIKRSRRIIYKDGLGVFKGHLKHHIWWNFYLRLPVQKILFKIFTIKNIYFNNRCYMNPKNPYDKISIKPSRIKYRLNSCNIYKGLGQIRTGNWDNDKYKTNLNNHPKIRAMEERFEGGKSWQQIGRYYKSPKGNYYDNLYIEIKNNGFDSDHRDSPPASPKLPRDGLSVLVVIDRNGEICHFDGSHRLGIARVLDIEIKAHVLCRHAEWQRFRDEVYLHDQHSDYKDWFTHPDMQDLFQ
jgi:hypothetical protein